MIRAGIDDDGVAQLTRVDPEHRNALRLEMTRALAGAVADALADGPEPSCSPPIPRCSAREVLDGSDAARLGLAWRCVPDEDLLPAAHALARRAAQRDAELVQRTKATLDASLGIGDDAAIALELEAQRWSMARPGFRERVVKIRARLAARAEHR
jgi:enoyl-CoA hydratase/carnithine racemase